jgi:hypothetical protein
MGLGEFFTNNEKTKEDEVDVGTPAFSITKVMSTVGTALATAVAAFLLLLPKGLQDDEAVVIAVIAALTLVLLGIFWLVAADFNTRQKAREATLRYGEGKTSAAKFQALPSKELILQLGHNSPEYEVRYATVEDGVVNLYADHEGTPIAVAFKEAPKPK